MSAISAILQATPKPFVGRKNAITRVRAVLMQRDRFLLAQHNSQRPENRGKWGLPGGRLKSAEKPKACLRRELIEELDCRVSYLVKLGDWLHRGEQHRVFGCEVEQPIDSFDPAELTAIDWFTFDDLLELRSANKLKTGFELAAALEFRRWLAESQRPR